MENLARGPMSLCDQPIPIGWEFDLRIRLEGNARRRRLALESERDQASNSLQLHEKATGRACRHRLATERQQVRAGSETLLNTATGCTLQLDSKYGTECDLVLNW